MKITTVGCGYLGAVYAASMASIGHEVLGLDVDQKKVDDLNAGIPPFHEPGFEKVLTEALASGRLRFSTDYSDAEDYRAHVICVGTPQQVDAAGADLTYVHAAVDSLIPHLDDTDVVLGRSTVPVGTAASLRDRLRAAGVNAALAWNPEFLREGFAVKDTLHPDRIVYGLPDDAEEAARARAALDEMYAPMLEVETPVVVGNYATAELVKVSANSFLATKISFINAVAEVCEATGADVSVIAEAIGLDDRIGPKFLRAGIGFGGGCLPKDIRAFMARAGELGVTEALGFLREVDHVNNRRRDHVVNIARRALGGTFTDKRVAVLGATFKPDSDDTRQSPALYIASKISGRGANVVITDPVANERVHAERPNLETAEDAYAAAAGADLVLLLTEWKEFRELDPVRLREVVGTAHLIDGRNALDPETWRAAGWTYESMGRP
ncbi:UDP-glucose dehydrogenase family protein [Brachybacterium sp. J153]|uniref:UDP-glucose dehydrogenase family protein n=1 Tax=Brachybacterium sp. J153 TaxID=3116488 RepID=UPI002E75ED96|nr:UDP-glucose/GDP-mannose dehydrogenase family protein [Brachybacterium sp. J153]MEE1617836.1 UDP-glucose/GDP-mannose dehydrogenase family protein [Brachybacterium sp. J153]